MSLSKAQKEIIEILKQGDFIWTNEGSNFKAWIGDEDSRRIKGIRIRTVEILLNTNQIALSEGNYPSGLFKYGLIKKSCL